MTKKMSPEEFWTLGRPAPSWIEVRGDVIFLDVRSLILCSVVPRYLFFCLFAVFQFGLWANSIDELGSGWAKQKYSCFNRSSPRG